MTINPIIVQSGGGGGEIIEERTITQATTLRFEYGKTIIATLSGFFTLTIETPNNNPRYIGDSGKLIIVAPEYYFNGTIINGIENYEAKRINAGCAGELEVDYSKNQLFPSSSAIDAGNGILSGTYILEYIDAGGRAYSYASFPDVLRISGGGGSGQD